MARPPLLLLGLLAAAAAVQDFTKGISRLRGILDSPVVQMLEERLGLQLPDVPEIDIDPSNLDINALLEQAWATGCVPEGTQVSEAVRNAVQTCTAQAAAAARPTRGRGNWRRNRWRGRGGRRGRRSIIKIIGSRIVAKTMRVAMQCVLKELTLLDEEGNLDQAALNTLIDDMIAEESFKTQKKDLVKLCFDSTPEFSDSSQRLAFQTRCIGQLNGLDCMLGVADTISPTVGFVARIKKGKCLAMGLEPPARFVMAKAACTSEEVSTMMRDRLAETAPSPDAGGSRRRRDADMMEALQSIGGLEGLANAIGAAGRDQSECRPHIFNKCPKRPTVKPVTPEELDRTLTRAEEVLGPLDDAFADVPVRAYSAAFCVHETLGTVGEDGAVDVTAVLELLNEFEGPEEATGALKRIVDTCDEMGAASSVDAFTDCLNTGAAYACSIHSAMMGGKPSAG